MKIFRCHQIREIDAYTIKHEPIPSIDLMERAAFELFKKIVAIYPYAKRVQVFTGPGNNGGDGVALARMLVMVGYNVSLYVIESTSYSKDLEENLQRIRQQGIVSPTFINHSSNLPAINSDDLIVDALFGSGLTRPLQGFSSLLVNYINSIGACVVSVDIPSGLFGEENPVPNSNEVIRANHTFSFQFPKLSFIFSENDQYVGKWEVVNIGLHPAIMASLSSPFYFTDLEFVKMRIPKRLTHSHKGSFGHCLIIAGSYGMVGASILSAKSCLKSGAGLVTVHVPKDAVMAMHASLPEVIVQADSNPHFFTGIESINKFTSVAFGSGVGQGSQTLSGFKKLLSLCTRPAVIDADGLNLIAHNKDLLNSLPQNSVLTPHVGEFNRLFGETFSGAERLNVAIKMAKKHSVIIVVKGANTQVVCPNGQVFVNSTGNPGMATAGSGDVLTGIIASLLAQGYSPCDACVVGVFIHGYAADLAAETFGQQSLVASDIVSHLGFAFNKLLQ
ncbi:MAG: NAD(P)H-hydrate dehydratase [Bacteroidales bacterium]